MKKCSSIDLFLDMLVVILYIVDLYIQLEVNALIQVLDLSHISSELAYAAEDADLVVMEGMVNHHVFLTFLSFIAVLSFHRRKKQYL